MIRIIDISAFDKKNKEVHARFLTNIDVENFLFNEIRNIKNKRIVIRFKIDKRDREAGK